MTKKNFQEIQLHEYLDKEKTAVLFIRVLPAQDLKTIEEFVVSLICTIGEKQCEVIRFDSTKKEPLNVHRFYYKPATKHYIEKDKNFETVEELMNHIRENWTTYLLKYMEKHYNT